MAISTVTCPWPGSVIWPWTRPPGAKAPSSFMPNQAPNSSALASARQTRDWGARRTISFSMRSVELCNFMVASYCSNPWKRNRLIAYMDREAPGSNPGPPTNFWSGLSPQVTAFFTSAPILASTSAVNSVRAKAVGHMAPSSRFASSLKPNVAYLVLNFCAGWKKQTTLPSFAYAGCPYQVFGERAGALALTTAWSRLAIARSRAGISAIFASRSLSPSALSAATFSSLTRSFIAPSSSSVNFADVCLIAVVLLADFCFAFIGGFLPLRVLMGTTLMLGCPPPRRLLEICSIAPLCAHGNSYHSWSFHGHSRPRKAAQGQGPHGSRIRSAIRCASPCAVGRDVGGSLLSQLQGCVRREPVQLPHDP